MNIWVYISNISWSIGIINVYDACITEQLQNWEKLFKTFLRHLVPLNSWHYDTFQHFQHFQYGELFYNGQRFFGRVDLYFERFLQSRFSRMGFRPPDLAEWSLPPCFLFGVIFRLTRGAVDIDSAEAWKYRSLAEPPILHGGKGIFFRNRLYFLALSGTIIRLFTNGP